MPAGEIVREDPPPRSERAVTDGAAVRVIRLAWGECRLAMIGGAERHLRNLYLGRVPRYGQVGHDWQSDIVGALGEWAFAKAMGFYWKGGGPDLDRGAGDVERWEIRTTEHRDGRLIVHPTDKDEAAFVLVCGGPPTFYLPGWMAGRDAKLDRFWQDPTGNGRPAYFVPQTVLRPFHELVHELAPDLNEAGR